MPNKIATLSITSSMFQSIPLYRRYIPTSSDSDSSPIQVHQNPMKKSVKIPLRHHFQIQTFWGFSGVHSTTTTPRSTTIQRPFDQKKHHENTIKIRPHRRCKGRDHPDGISQLRFRFTWRGGGPFFGKNLLFLIGRDARLHKTM